MAIKKLSKKPTLSDIKRTTKREMPYFFDKKSMKHFGQTMKSFKIHRSPSGRCYLYADTYSLDHRTGKNEFMGVMVNEYIEKGMNSDLRHKFIKGKFDVKKLK